MCALDNTETLRVRGQSFPTRPFHFLCHSDRSRYVGLIDRPLLAYRRHLEQHSDTVWHRSGIARILWRAIFPDTFNVEGAEVWASAVEIAKDSSEIFVYRGTLEEAAAGPLTGYRAKGLAAAPRAGCRAPSPPPPGLRAQACTTPRARRNPAHSDSAAVRKPSSGYPLGQCPSASRGSTALTPSLYPTQARARLASYGLDAS